MNISKRGSMLSSSPLYTFFGKVKEAEAAGKKIISLGLGEPFYDTPEEIKKAGIDAICENKTHYNPATGSFGLRKEIAKKYGVDVDCVAVSSGAKPFLGSVIWSLINEGDVVFLAGPYYPPFLQIIISCGGVPVIIHTKDTGFQMTAQLVEKAIAENNLKGKNACIIINSPNNPTGVIYEKSELKKIVEICGKNGITIISDECYMGLSGQKDFTLREFSEDVIVINSLSKSHAMTGWRIGYVIAPKELNVVISRFLENYIGCPSSISDAAAIKALQLPPIEDFIEQRKIMHEWLKNNEIPFAPSSGGIFIFPDFMPMIEKLGLKGSEELATYILEKANVAVTPGISFGQEYDTYLRISYCVEIETLKKALEGIEKIFKS